MEPNTAWFRKNLPSPDDSYREGPCRGERPDYRLELCVLPSSVTTRPKDSGPFWTTVVPSVPSPTPLSRDPLVMTLPRRGRREPFG